MVLSLTSGVSLTTVALCVVVLLCPVVLWEDVMWESLVQRSATPPPEKKRKKKKIGQKKGRKFDGKSRIWQKRRGFSLWAPLLDILGVLRCWIVALGCRWMCSPEGNWGVQPAPGSGRVWTAITMEWER